jgi:hypothetical protein
LGSAIAVAPLLYLDPTYCCQISSTLHISLSELEQVALNFTLPSAALRSTRRRSPSAALPPSAAPRCSRHRRRLVSRRRLASAAIASAAIGRRHRPPRFRCGVPRAGMGRTVGSERQGTGRLVPLVDIGAGPGIRNPCRHLQQ